ncbi:hypothetical protein MTR_3g109770 [Medicago truncatula]|uniref:Uncharacterized protein n=1 Tax=Medicago truncatula TaxID=3880 RepID=G7J3H1_MEDTR|nr:hypothetical protein MTR_3g109770 [Medicago truncatula]
MEIDCLQPLSLCQRFLLPYSQTHMFQLQYFFFTFFLYKEFQLHQPLAIILPSVLVEIWGLTHPYKTGLFFFSLLINGNGDLGILNGGALSVAYLANGTA